MCVWKMLEKVNGIFQPLIETLANDNADNNPWACSFFSRTHGFDDRSLTTFYYRSMNTRKDIRLVIYSIQNAEVVPT